MSETEKVSQMKQSHSHQALFYKVPLNSKHSQTEIIYLFVLN